MLQHERSIKLNCFANDPVNFKFSLIVLSCFSETRHIKLFQDINTSYENNLSKVVESTVKWAMDTLKIREKENGEVFLCNHTVHIISEICGV